jgi:N4-gp56 family major capsid protein
MAIQTYDFAPGRIEKTAGEMLTFAKFTEVLTGATHNISMPENKSENLIVRQIVPYGGTVASPNIFTVSAAAHITQEGVTPSADTIVPRDVTFTLQQYMALYAFTDKQKILYEDDIPMAMKKNCGQRMGLVREMAIYGGMKACTNKFYAGGTSRSTVDGKVTPKLLRRITRSLAANHGKTLRPMIAPSSNYGSTSVEASYVLYTHTDLEADFRDLPNFKTTSDYGTRAIISEHELGTWEKLRIVCSADLAPIADAGAAVGALDLLSTTGSNADVYPVIIMAEEAFAQVSLRKRTDFEPLFIPTTPSKSDPGGQRGYLGAKFWHTNGVLNNGWMAVAEVACSALSD